MSTLGTRIRFLRGKISQDVFSATIGISKGSLGGYERDENLPNTNVVLKICQQTGISVEWLLTGRGNGTAAAPPMDEASAADGTENRTHACASCLKLENALEKLDEERRELNAENRRLWKENSELGTRAARLEGCRGSVAALPADKQH
jgi:transcriptional regulator with XRE-family HTH domain